LTCELILAHAPDSFNKNFRRHHVDFTEMLAMKNFALGEAR